MAFVPGHWLIAFHGGMGPPTGESRIRIMITTSTPYVDTQPDVTILPGPAEPRKLRINEGRSRHTNAEVSSPVRKSARRYKVGPIIPLR